MKSDPKLSSFDSLVDLERLKEVSDGGADGLHELALMYIQSMDGNLLKLQDAIDQKRAEEAERIAHSAVGASALVGMIGLVPILRKIESLCERKEFTQLPTVLSELKETYSLICEGLRSRGIIKETMDT